MRQTPQARTWTSSSPGPGAGTGFSTYLSGLVSIGPGWLTTHACIVFEAANSHTPLLSRWSGRTITSRLTEPRNEFVNI